LRKYFSGNDGFFKKKRERKLHSLFRAGSNIRKEEEEEEESRRV
jgi:hypothetical protein